MDETGFESLARDVSDYVNNERRATDSKTFGRQIKGTFNNTALRGGRIVIVSRLCIIRHRIILHHKAHMEIEWISCVSRLFLSLAASCKKCDAQNIYSTEQIHPARVQLFRL